MNNMNYTSKDQFGYFYLTTVTTFNSSVENATNLEYPFAPESIIVPIVFGLLIVIGVFGNSVVIYVMLRHGEKTTTNCYVVNLAVADMAFILWVIPITMMHYILPDWIFGDFICKSTMYMIYVTLHATCLTLTAMTVDRYVSIVHPISSMTRRSPKKAVSVSVGIWILSLLLCTPFFMYNGIIHSWYYGPRIYCRETWPHERDKKIAIVYVVTATYVIPLVVIILCYALTIRFLWNRHEVRPVPATARENGHRTSMDKNRRRKRRRVTRMVAVIVVLFATFWMPIHIFQLWFKFDRKFPKGMVMYSFKIFAHTLSYANSCVNPIVYCFLGDSFRKAVKKAFPRYFKKLMLTTTYIDERGQSHAVSQGHMGEESRVLRSMSVDNRADQTEMSELMANNNSTANHIDPIKKRIVAMTVLNQFHPLIIEEDGEILESTPIPKSTETFI